MCYYYYYLFVYLFNVTYFRGNIILLLIAGPFQKLLEGSVIYLPGLISSLSRLTSPFGRWCLWHN